MVFYREYIRENAAIYVACGDFNVLITRTLTITKTNTKIGTAQLK